MNNEENSYVTTKICLNVIPLLKSAKVSLSNWSLRLGQTVLIKYAGNTMHCRKFSGYHVSLWVGFSFKCLASASFLFLSS